LGSKPNNIAQSSPNDLLEMSIMKITWLRVKKIKNALNGLILDIYVKLSIKIKTMDDQTLLNVVHVKK
jgi:hypothetical protein